MEREKVRFSEGVRANRDIMYTLALLLLRREDAAVEVVEDAVKAGYFNDRIPHRKAAFQLWILGYVYREALMHRRLENYVTPDADAPCSKSLPQLGLDLSELPPESCAAGALCYCGNLSLSQIAAVLGVSRVDAAAYLDSAREQLKSTSNL